MASRKPTSVSAPKEQKAVKTKPVKSEVQVTDKSSEELVIENFAALSQLVESLSETLDMLVQKAESMAIHIIATEEMMAEIVADNGLNLARVNARIRAKIASGSDNTNDASRAIDVAAAIASPLPRR